MGSKLCPDCLSSVDAEDLECPQCGADLQRRRRARWPVIAAVAAVAVAGAGLWAWQRSHASDVTAARVDTGTETEPPPAPDFRPSPPAPRGPAHHWVLGTEAQPEVDLPALVLEADGGGAPALLLPITSLPLEGGLVDDRSAPLAVKVLAHNLEFGFVLLTPGRAPPEAIEALPARASGDLPVGAELTAHTVDLQTESARLAGRTADGLGLIPDRDLTPGSVVVHDGAAVGYVDGPRHAIPLDRALPFLGQAGTRNLGSIQQELAEWSPAHLRAQIEELLALPASADRLRRALELLARLALRARDRATLEELEQQLRQTHTQLVRLLARTDRIAALREVRVALARFPTHPPLVADAVVLELDAGSPDQAIQLYHQLLALSPEHAERLRDDLASGLRAAAEERRRDQRLQEALDLLAEAVLLFPDRADLHAARARALAAADLDAAALAAAEIAARLDPSYESSLAEYRRAAAEQPEDPSRLVKIPFDPATGSIRTEVRVGGEPVQLVVDTGATLTTLPVAVVERLGLMQPGLPMVKVTTASGVVEAPLVRVPDITIGSIRLRRVRAVALDLPGTLAGKGLLGLNVLRRLHMQLDSENGVLLLERRRRRNR